MLCSTLISSSKRSSFLEAMIANMTQGTIAIERVSNTRFHLAHLRPRKPCEGRERREGGRGGRERNQQNERIYKYLLPLQIVQHKYPMKRDMSHERERKRGREGGRGSEEERRRGTYSHC